MKKLPKVFQNDFSKIINNNKQVCYLKNDDSDDLNRVVDVSTISIMSILDDIFSGIGYSYNIPLEIKTKSRVYNTSLIARTNQNLITLDNDVIPIVDVVNIKILNK